MTISVAEDFSDATEWKANSGMTRIMTGTAVEVTKATHNTVSGPCSGCFLTAVDLSSTINRCPGCRMLLEVVGGQKNDIAADDVTVSVMYRYISGSSWIEIGGAQKKLPTDTSATTTIEFQPPIGQASNNNQLHLRINFQTASVGTSFVS